MIELGQYNVMTVARETDHGVFLIKDGNIDEAVLLPGKTRTEDLNVDDEVRVFIYTDSEDRIIATRETPKAVVGEFASLLVVDTNEYGAFLDWGLMKDLFVPFKQQPWPLEVGHRVVVHVLYDEVSDRIIATAKLHSFFFPVEDALQIGDEVEAIIYDQTDTAYDCVASQRFKATIYKEAQTKQYKTGDVARLFVIKMGDRLVLSERKGGFEETMDEKYVFLERLEDAGGFLPYNSKTPSDIIQKELGLSKKLFKKIIGMLYKDRIITIEDNGIRIVEK